MIEEIFGLFGNQNAVPVIVEIVMALLFMAFLVSEAIEFLKARQLIKNEQAGVWSKWVNMIISLGTIIAINVGAGDQVDNVVQIAGSFAAMCAQLVIQVTGSKLWHELMKKTGGHLKTPPAVVEAPQEVG